MIFILKSFFLFLLISLIVADIPLETEVYITNINLPGNYVFTIKEASQEDGALLIIAPLENLDNQKFIISYRTGYYVIKAFHSGKLLTFVEDGDYVIQKTDLDGTYWSITQDFTIEPRYPPNYCLRSRSKGTFLQFDFDFDYVAGNWIAVTNVIKQAIPTFGNPQEWQFVDASEQPSPPTPPADDQNSPPSPPTPPADEQNSP